MALKTTSFVLILLFLNLKLSKGATITGKVTDNHTKEVIISATIYLPELNKGTTTGLDGSYRISGLPNGIFRVECHYIGYKTEITSVVIKSDNEQYTLNFTLSSTSIEIDEIQISVSKDQSSEHSARITEKMSNAVVNVVSAKYIQLSPDINVASAVQRISGITLEKGTAGANQYALLRGMDKRYNSTLVNGIRIPGTHNKYRYVALELFPSELLDRLEVFKSLTPDMEADAIAGIINMVMKNAPDSFTYQFNMSTGYSMFFNNHDFLTFNTRDINKLSPYELHGSKYNAVVEDFPTSFLKTDTNYLPISSSVGFNFGKRYFKRRLGIILSGSFSQIMHGTESILFDVETSRDSKNLPLLKQFDERVYTENQMQYGIHSMVDFRFNKKNKLQLYSVFLDTRRVQIRNTNSTELEYGYAPNSGTAVLYYNTRFRLNNQYLFNSTLQGEHLLGEKLQITWSSVFSQTKNISPDNAIIDLIGGTKNFVLLPTYVSEKENMRRWEHNTDMDIAAYFKIKYPLSTGIGIIDLSSGFLFRHKVRKSFYNQYILQPYEADKPPAYRYFSEKGVDWNTYDEINWRVYNPRGSVATA